MGSLKLISATLIKFNFVLSISRNFTLFFFLFFLKIVFSHKRHLTSRHAHQCHIHCDGAISECEKHGWVDLLDDVRYGEHLDRKKRVQFQYCSSSRQGSKLKPEVTRRHDQRDWTNTVNWMLTYNQCALFSY